MKIIKCLIFFLLFSGVLQNAYANEYVMCEAKHNLYHGNFSINAIYRFVMRDKSGVILINGSAHQGEERYTISREIRFLYNKQSGVDYHFSDSKIRKNPLDNIPEELAMRHYPKFFYQDNNSINFLITKTNGNDYIISFVSTPYFYCNGI